MNITISNDDALERAYDMFHDTQNFYIAVARATNRTLEGIGTDIVRETKERYFAKPGDIRKTLKMKKARASGSALYGMVISHGKRKTLADYKLTPKTPKKGMKGLQGAVKRDGGLKKIERVFLLKRGRVYNPYTRTGLGKWAIQMLPSPAIPQILKNEETVKIIEKKAQERFAKRLDHEIIQVMKDYGD